MSGATLRALSVWPADAPALAVASLAALLLLGSGSGWLAPGAPAFPAPPPPAARSAPPAVPAGDAAGEPSTPLDLNRADALALQTLPGIGPVLAERIVAYRQAHGPFARGADLRRVAGIGSGRWAQLEGRVRAGAP